jgi:hypothetical protein
MVLTRRSGEAPAQKGPKEGRNLARVISAYICDGAADRDVLKPLQWKWVTLSRSQRH